MAFLKIQQQIAVDQVSNPYETCEESIQDSGWLAAVGADETVCIGLPSRGISAMRPAAKALIDALLARGARPFIVPAMGSHGGADAAGQAQVLEGYGLGEADLGAPIRSQIEAVRIGQVMGELGQAVDIYWDAHAARADHVIVINRVKPHTAFSGEFESGLFKILTVGLGKPLGAKTIHTHGLKEMIPLMAKEILRIKPVLGGIAIVENGRHQPMRIEAIPAVEIETREPELLALARQTLPRVPFRHLDLLVVDQMGKDISGTGMDTNVIGKYRRNWGEPEPDYERIAVLNLTAASHGNATGVGFADVITRRLRGQIDVEATAVNCITAGNFTGAKIPVSAPTDRAVVELALTGKERETAQIAIIRSTLDLEQFYVSEALREDVVADDSLSVLEEGIAFDDLFDEDGTLKLDF